MLSHLALHSLSTQYMNTRTYACMYMKITTSNSKYLYLVFSNTFVSYVQWRQTVKTPVGNYRYMWVSIPPHHYIHTWVDRQKYLQKKIAKILCLFNIKRNPFRKNIWTCTFFFHGKSRAMFIRETCRRAAHLPGLVLKTRTTRNWL